MISLKTKEQQFDCCMLKLNRIIKSDIQYEVLSIIRTFLGYIRNGGLCMDSTLRDKINEFAAAFLMPKELYKRVMDENTVGNAVYIAKVAQYFNVSIDAASYRGKWLGYLQW